MTSSTSQVKQLTPEEQQQVQQLRQTDRQVRAHEQAHLAVGADLVRGGPSYSYQTGPDNQRYAVSGEVSIDTSPGRSPAETIPKAQHIRATALAPAEPSPQDNSVAAQASSMESEARIELAVQQREQATSADRGNARLYQGVEQSDKRPVGVRLDLFA
ncbi:putative metalloprotease CJM1_0395 family protein [Propionivibrio sp.]|uniref:putative metalloprotease CJM1_0395 family protein n=1 Tax=Propionivibrio sp. TaxID=2212460 RepID=UPI002617EE03|nr:putative metalloprotease CJM1_0395 family protein [Propionivibrio sp.]